MKEKGLTDEQVYRGLQEFFEFNHVNARQVMGATTGMRAYTIAQIATDAAHAKRLCDETDTILRKTVDFWLSKDTP